MLLLPDRSIVDLA